MLGEAGLSAPNDQSQCVGPSVELRAFAVSEALAVNPSMLHGLRDTQHNTARKNYLKSERQPSYGYLILIGLCRTPPQGAVVGKIILHTCEDTSGWTYPITPLVVPRERHRRW